MRRGIAVEVADERALVGLTRALRERGLARLEAYTPYAIPQLDGVLGARRSPMAIVSALGAFCGALGGYALQWLLNAYLYPVDAGGRPPHMPLAFVVITVEMGFLFGGLAAFFGCLAAGRLVRLWEPIQDVEGFGSATRAGYWLAIDAEDPAFDRPAVEAVVAEAKPLRHAWFGGAR